MWWVCYGKGKQAVGELGLGNDRELAEWTPLPSFSDYICGTD